MIANRFLFKFKTRVQSVAFHPNPVTIYIYYKNYNLKNKTDVI